MSNIRIALVGDYSATVTAHRAISPALELAGKVLNVKVEPVWIHTSKLASNEQVLSLLSYDGIWCVPASPYANTDGAISAISLARTRAIPFLGTCAGFQHALMEYCSNVLGVTDVAHEELNPGAKRPLISKLSCSLVEAVGKIRLTSGSSTARFYGKDSVEEDFHCNYGVNPEFAGLLQGRNGLLIEGTDDAGDIRIIRLAHHPFFLATLFQPERSSLKGLVHPLIREFVSASASGRVGDGELHEKREMM
jgi:CTP synthase (UTP-ammonia lyase)